MHLNLRASIVLAVICGLLIPVSISTLLTLRQQERALEEQFSSDHQRLAELLALGLQDPLWNLSSEAAWPLFDSVLSDERVASVVVSDSKAGVFLSRGHPERRQGKQVMLARNIVHDNDVVIGSVAIEMDTGRLDSAVANYRRIFMLTVIGQLMLSLILIITLLQVRVLAPIKRLMRESEQLARREHNIPFVWSRGDEIGSLGRTLESTRQALQELFNALEAKNLTLKGDIERRVQIESELKRHRDHLEELVNQRTAVLAKRSEELARSNAELEQMAYVASHDLNEPLRMVASYVQLLEQRYRDRLDADAHEFIGFAVDGAKRMQALIDDLLTYSRVGTKPVSPKPVDCAAVVATVLHSMRIAIEESGGRVNCGPLPVVMSDASQLTQLFQNLIANAIKFRRDKAPEVHVNAKPENGFWHFSVQDNGIGIPPEYANRVFEMFQRLHGRRVYPGTGIGLAICKKIVERQGGRIWVEPDPAGGSIFQFTLPQEQGETL
jgi:signal transduction histidine kinase